jgi:pimeloyl-ACP methyl ester carboxylesterase
MAADNSVMVNGQPVYYTVRGAGEPVVLVHGFAEDGTLWQNQVPVLENKYRLIIPDLPGSGRSAISNEQLSTANVQWSMDYFAECIRHILDKEGIEAVAMIGHSMGGYITLAFAEKYPHRLSLLGLFHSTAFADSEEKKTTRRRGIEFIQQNGAARFLEQVIGNTFCDEFKKQQPATVKEIITRFINFEPLALIKYYEAMMARPDRTAVLKSFPRPVLLISGRYDAAVPLEQGLQQSYMPGLCYFHILEHSAHMGMWEEPRLANTFLSAFLMHGEIA